MHAEVWLVRIALGVQLTFTETITGEDVTGTAAEPNFVVSCTDVAVTIAVPAPDGVNTPPAVIVPPVADHVTAEL